VVVDKHDGRLIIGAVEIDITPPIGVPMAGYAARKGNSAGIHDPLMAQALYLQNGSDEIMILTCDLIGIDLNITSKIRDDISKETGIPHGNIMIACSHTHSGPQGFTPDEPIHMGLKDEGLVEITQRKLLGAARWAISQQQIANLSFSTLPVTGVGKNRNNPEEGPQDTQLSVLRFDDIDGDPIAVLFNYGCHPTVMGHDNLQITADLPGAARRALKKQFPSCTFIFTNGASGDISTRFTRRAQNFSEVERLGIILAGGVLQGIQKAEPLEVNQIGTECVNVELPIRELPSTEEINNEVKRLQEKLTELKENSASSGEQRKVITQLEGAEGQLIMVRELEGVNHFSTQLQFLHIGSIAVVSIPGEPFSQTVLDIKEACFPQPVFAVSYANDIKGYFPDKQSITQGTYEALISPYDLRVSEIIYQETIKHCKKE
jgi:hypothetical protein